MSGVNTSLKFAPRLDFSVGACYTVIKFTDCHKL